MMRNRQVGKLGIGLGLLLILILSGVVYAQGEGVIEGQVVNGTADGPPVGAGITVTLRLYQGDAVTDTLTTTTDAEGRFRFEGLDTDPALGYQPQARYQGVTYSSPPPPLSFAGEQTALETTISVYETTEDDAAITLDSVHIIADSFGEVLRISEIHLFGNSGDRTYVGETTVRIPLPPGAEGLSYHQGAEEERFIQEGDMLLDTAPVPPGRESSLAFFSYHLMAAGGSVPLERQFAYPVGQLNILAAQPGLQIESDQLIAKGPENFQGRQYALYSATGLGPDAPLVATLIPVVDEASPGGGAMPPDHPGAAASGRGSQGVLRWLGFALAGLVLAGGVAYVTATRSQAAPPAPAWETDPQARRLLVQLADLEDDYEAGRVEADEYERRRAALYDEVRSRQP